jgi:flagellar motor switch protein FliM
MRAIAQPRGRTDMPDQNQQKTAPEPAAGKQREKQHSVVSCNFRTAGRLSNENARSLTAIHESFARHLANALDAWLGTAVEVRLKALDQLPMKEHIAAIPALACLVPFSLATLPNTMIVQCDLDLVFPIIELLLGGKTVQGGTNRDLSEIEEEIMLDVTALIARQAESAWHMPPQTLKIGRRIKSSSLHQYCPPNEKVTLVKFEVDVAGATGSFQIVFPTAFLNMLIQQIKNEQPQKRGSVRHFPRPSIRERILDCDVTVTAELAGLRVSVRDLVTLETGSVLKLRAPIHTPGLLTAGGQGLFEAVPVRNGSQKAAQLGRRIPSFNWERN